MLVLVLIVLTIPVGATSVDTETIVPDSFIELCDLVFSGHGEVYDESNQDVTQIFCSNYLNYYNSGNYAAILNGCYEDISCIRTHKISTVSVQRRLELTKSYEEQSTHFVTHTGFPYNGKSWYFVVTASGTFTYNDGNAQISHFPTPTYSFSFVDIGSGFTGSVTSMTSSQINMNSARTSVSFSVDTTHTVTYPIPNLITPGTLGPYSHTSSFTVSI